MEQDDAAGPAGPEGVGGAREGGDRPAPPPTIPVLARPPAPVPERLRWHPIWPALGAVLLLVAALAGGAGLLRAPYIVYAPGSAIDTAPAIDTPGTESFDDEGDIVFLTVSLRGVSRQVSYAEAAWGWLRSDQDVFPRRLILGDQSGDESRERSLQMMQGSQQVAAKVALEHLGYEVPSRGQGAVVASVVAGGPSEGGLVAGDVIVAVDGTDVEIDTDLRDVLATKRPGDEVELRVARGAALAADGLDGAEEEVVEVELYADPEAPAGEEPRALVGITTFTFALEYELPFPVDIDTDDVGGPSAGLALTLGILDRLTPGSLTGGRTVAVTGEIAPDGQVAEVGGVAQKAAVARRAGADLLLVPAGEADEARANAGDVLVVGVADLDEALAALAELGGNALELEGSAGP